jgi:hypothetical protein
MVRYKVSSFREQGTGNREQGTVAGRPEMMPNQVILHIFEKGCNQDIGITFLSQARQFWTKTAKKILKNHYNSSLLAIIAKFKDILPEKTHWC